jgi:hypothetical protein
MAWLPPLLAIVGGFGLVAATFMAWYAGGDIEGAYFNRTIGAPAYAGVFSTWAGGRNAWEAFTTLDIALVVFAALALAAGLGALSSVPARLRRVVCLATVFGGIGVSAWVLDRIFDRPVFVGLGPGAVIGFAAIVVAVLGALLSLSPSSRTAERSPS